MAEAKDGNTRSKRVENKELRELFKDIDKKFKTSTSETVIRNEPNLIEKLEKLKSPKLQALFILALILSCISFTATPVIFFLLVKFFSVSLEQ